MEKREQVFLSSTYVDLEHERQEVIQTLLQLDCIPSGMELFPASDDDKWELIKQVIEDADYYVLLIGARYGSVDSDSGLSYTEMEYDYAVQRGKPVLAFLHAHPDDVPAGKTDLSDDKRKQLQRFRDKASGRAVNFWSSPAELGGRVATSLVAARKRHPAEGWVRGSNAMTPEREREWARLQSEIVRLEQEVDRLKQAERPSLDSLDTSSLAQGQDLVALETKLTYRPSGASRSNKFAWFSLESTWDSIFRRLGTYLLDEASEETLEDHLDTYCTELWVAAWQDGSLPGSTPADMEQAIRAEIDSQGFEDVKVQFFSLGLIERSERRRPVSDSNTYWKLTRLGTEHLMHLRAKRRAT